MANEGDAVAPSVAQETASGLRSRRMRAGTAALRKSGGGGPSGHFAERSLPAATIPASDHSASAAVLAVAHGVALRRDHGVVARPAVDRVVVEAAVERVVARAAAEPVAAAAALEAVVAVA